VALVFDVISVLAFVFIGRRVHAHGLSLAGDASTAWPFLVGAAIGSVSAWRLSGFPLAVRSGVVVWLSTVAVGMALRAVAGQGVAFAFVLVALAWFAATMLGWRLLPPLYALSRERRAGRGTYRRR
jgi:hypothetical protein